MQQRVVTLTAVAGLAAFGVLAGVQKACSQAPGRPARAAVSSTNPSGAVVNSTVASDAAYGERAGEGRNATPTPAETAQQGAEPSPEFGRPNPGRPEYEDPEYQGPRGSRASGQGRAQAQGGGQGQDQNQGQGQDGGGNAGSGPNGENGREDAEDNVLVVNDGFFFDNYTSGSGFGVYGGEAVTSGQGQQLNLPSAGVNARNLGLPVLPTQPVGTGQPQQPQDPGDPDS